MFIPYAIVPEGEKKSEAPKEPAAPPPPAEEEEVKEQPEGQKVGDTYLMVLKKHRHRSLS